MFHKTTDERLSSWSTIRKMIADSDTPLQLVANFWADAPRIAHNHNIDPYNYRSWPTPWEIIVTNKYDDFSLALMMGYTLKLTPKFSEDLIQIKTLVNQSKTQLYNLVFVNNEYVLNYERDEVTQFADIDSTLYLENQVDVIFPR